MKTHHLFFTICLTMLLASCSESTSKIDQVKNGAPIKPIMYSGAEQDIYLTDYVPSLFDLDFNYALFGEDTLSVAEYPTSFVLTLPEGKSAINKLDLVWGKEVITIPVVDKQMQYSSSIYIKSSDDEKIDISFGESRPLHASIVVWWQNRIVYSFEYKNGLPIVELSIPYKELLKQVPAIKGRSFLRVFVNDGTTRYNDLLLPLEDMKPLSKAEQLTRHDHEAQVLYSLMVDRFYNGNTANDWKMNSEEVLDIVDYQGGDLKGITKKIEEGFFDDLEVNTIWVSPITQNPYDAWGKYTFKANGDGTYDNKYDATKAYTKFSGYHGYWPIYVTAIDQRLGTDDELRELLTVAHEHNINIILDYVANHMHISSPTLQEHPDWHTDSILPDGRRNFELWDEARLTTWFDTHIPTLDLERKEVYEPMTDSALFWLEQFDLDGFRHDACKHIPEAYWRTLTQKMHTRFPERSLWMIGETYGSPDLIGSYVKTGMLDAQFDFNVYFTAIHALVEETGSMQDINRVIEESLAAYGAHHTMGNISGNHDQVRFTSLAGGAISFGEDGKEAGWTREIGAGDKDIAYQRALLLEILNLTIPGVPCIYQGDEYGEVGGNDPDNRHMMRFAESGYTEQENQMLHKVKEMIHLRRNSLALTYGDYIPLFVSNEVLCFKRVYLGEEVIVAINKSYTEQTIAVEGKTITIAPISAEIQTN